MIKNLLLIALLVTSVAAFAEPAKDKKTEKEYWEETDLDFDSLKVAVNKKACVESDKAYLACYAALDLLERVSTNTSVLLPESYYNQHTEDYGAVLATYPPLVLAKIKKRESVNKIEDWKKYKKQEAEINAAVLATKPAINFEKILEELSLNVGFQTKPQPKLAAALNSYFSMYYDPHTHIDPTDYIEQQYNSTDDQVVGIGIRMRELKGKILVNDVIPGGPADLAGLKPNDLITHADGVALDTLSFDDAASRIRGKEGTTVVLDFQRNGEKKQVKIVRKAVIFPNVVEKVFEDQGKKYGYVRLGNFMEKSVCAKISAAITSLEKKQVQGLVFDLRGNGGGLLDQAVCIIGLFVGKDKVAVKVKDLNSEKFHDYLTGYQLSGAPFEVQYPSTNLPMVTLIDAGSASASEVVAGALQDYGRSWIVGDRSFGKGTVQAVTPFHITPDGFITGVMVPSDIMIAKTIQRFYQPSGNTNQMVGIIPEFKVPSKLGMPEEEQLALREEDLYSNALVAVNPPHQVTNPDVVLKVNDCVNASASAPSSIQPDDDYQLYSAGKIMTCSVARGITIQRH